MKTGRRRGMRDIATIQSLSGRSVPRSREHIIAELARLEHEKARLERELYIWVSNLRRTEDQLLQIEERLALLQQAVDLTSSSSSGEATRTSVQPTSSPEPGGDWKSVVLEY